jgi:predicted DNA-binding transcriptional regulator AlpA
VHLLALMIRLEQAVMSKRRDSRSKHLRAVTAPAIMAAPARVQAAAALDRVVSEAEAAAIIGFSKDTLRREFKAGRAPARIRLSGRRIGYRLSAIYAFLEAHTEKPTAMS